MVLCFKKRDYSDTSYSDTLKKKSGKISIIKTKVLQIYHKKRLRSEYSESEYSEIPTQK